MIFCVEDDQSIRDLMIYALNSAGFAAIGFSDSEALFSALKEKLPELIMLDIMLPGEDGIEILKKLRKNAVTSNVPVIMATAKGTEYDKVMGLDAGADDYLAKPFGMMEMVSRVKAVLRRSGGTCNSQILKLGDLEMNESSHTVSACGKKVELALKEYELLRLFLDNPGQVFTRNQIFDRIWGMDFAGESRTVDVHIGTLRTKLGACGKYIETVRGVGYRSKSV
ncbi:MAG: response regulator transcription factor [Acutalibacteraceae bacterium]|nr:response regulator transcription factor [Acutalibacteraceae bacterium]